MATAAKKDEMDVLDDEIFKLERKTVDLYAVGRIAAALKVQQRAAYLRQEFVKLEIARATAQ